MSILYINTGSSANAGDGDSLRTAFTKINENFQFIDSAGIGSGGNGYTGSQGEYGYAGSAGYEGSRGFTGSRGAGYTGSASTIPGYVGSRGYVGSAGFAGSQGAIGPIGYIGSASTEVGYAGSQGDQGPIGYVGSQSTEIGYTGSQGFGEQGYTGSQGTVGYAGSRGDLGYTGSIGPEGPQGYSPDVVPGGIYIQLDDANPIGTNLGYVYASTLTQTFINGQAVRLRANIMRMGNTPIAIGVISQDGGAGALLVLDENAILTMYQMSPGYQTPISQQYDLSTVLFGVNRYLTMEWQVTPDSVNGSVLFGSVIGVGQVEMQQVDPFFLNLSDIVTNGPFYLCAYSAGGRQDIADIAYELGIGIGGANGFTGSAGAGYTGSASTAIGYTGSSGTDGYAGSIGFTGSAGFIGSASTAAGYAGSQGYDGSTGFIGSKGPAGYVGSHGVIGYTGSRGFAGSQGYSGSQGDTGYIGSFGYTGSQGDQGIQGDQGQDGATGFTGSVGFGFTGSAGVGYTGSRSTLPGYAGSRGYAGSSGAYAAVGYTGSAGTGSVDLSAVNQNIIPSLDSTYSLGSPTRQWKSLYVSTNTVYIGNVPITVNTATNTLQVGTAGSALNVATESYVQDYVSQHGSATDWANIGNINNNNGPTQIAIGQFAYSTSTYSVPNRFASVIWDGAQFVAVGNDVVSNIIVATSPDGGSWTNHYTNFNGLNFQPTSIVYNGSSQYVMCGYNYSIYPSGNFILTSPDAINWTQQSSGNVANALINTMVWNGTQYVGVGYDYNNQTSLILTSTNGVSWTRQAILGSILYGVTWSDTQSQYVAVGRGNSRPIFTSPDGVTWTQREPLDFVFDLYSVIWDSIHSQYVAVGADGLGLTLIFTSPDGVTWTKRYPPLIPGGTTVVSIAVDGSGNYVAVGYNNSTYSDIILSSIDAGVTWIQQAQNLSYDLSSIIYASNVFLAVGRSIVLAGDVATWYLIANPTPQNNIAIGQYAGNKFQDSYTIAIGTFAGYTGQGNTAVAMGYYAGFTGQGANAIAVGANAGFAYQAANTIILNATGNDVDGVRDQPNSTYIAPIRNDVTATNNTLYYNTTTFELTYGPGGTPSTIDGGVADSSAGLTVTAHTLSTNQYDVSGSITYNIRDAGATTAGIIVKGLTIPATQTITGGFAQGNNTISWGNDFTIDGEFWNHVVSITAFVTDSRGYTFYSPVTDMWEVPHGPCLVEGTQITMADGTHKAIEGIQHGELIRVWNFDLGEFDEAQPIWIKAVEETTEHGVYTFSDGTQLRTVGHNVFNKEAGSFTKLKYDETPIGTTTFNEQGLEVTLVSKERVVAPTRYYNVWTQYHLNLFADGILTSNRFNNIYPIVDMKFVKDNRALRSVDEFAGIDEKYITGLRLQEQTYDVEYIQDYVHNRLERLDIANTIEQGI